MQNPQPRKIGGGGWGFTSIKKTLHGLEHVNLLHARQGHSHVHPRKWLSGQTKQNARGALRSPTSDMGRVLFYWFVSH